MKQRSLADEQKRMNALRRRADAAMKTWDVTAVGGKIALVASDGPDSEIVAIFHEDASLDNRDYLLHSAREGFFLLEKVDEVSNARREPRAERQQTRSSRPAEDNAKTCGRLCNDRAFLTFLSTRKNIDTSDSERVAVEVRKLLGVESRTELTTDPEAAIRWRDLHAEFQAWMRGY